VAKRYWLFKTEPEAFSIEDLINSPGKTAPWDGVRNYQARNFLRDDVQVGDEVLFYHSNAKPPAIVGIAIVTRAGYPDHTAFEPKHEHYDPKSDRTKPTWYMVDLKHAETFVEPITLPRLKSMSSLKNMVLLQRSRLSIQPVASGEWKQIVALGRAADRRS
jgi:predicted RNA-binding protein with PUA-like domain